MDIGPSLTWNELADLYDKAHSSKARTLPMERVFDWAEKQKDKFFVDAEGELHQILGELNGG